jgi:nucleoside-diphosphate-sugar epimerase
MAISVLITGGAGYVGSILTERFVNQGYLVTVYDNFMYRQNTLLNLCYQPNVKFIRGDVRDVDSLLRQVSKHDIIIPLAAIVGMPACKKNPLGAKQINQDQIENICQAKSKDQLLLYPNTNSGYGQGEGAVFTEKDELNPISVYGQTKCEAEKMVRNTENSLVFRLATVFGCSPKMRLDLLVNDFTYRAWNDGFISLFEGHFKRNYVHVRDVAAVFDWCISHWDLVKNDVYNFGLSNANLTKRELCDKIKVQIPNFKIVEFEGDKDPDQRNYIVQNTKIENKGFKASISVERGIDELLKSFEILNPSIYTNL